MKNVDESESRDPTAIFWVGSSKKDLRSFPKPVRRTVGQALNDAQFGGKHPDAKPLKGFGGAGVLEIVEDDDGATYRAVYTIKFADAVYVLHAFQKKSKSGSKTPGPEIDKIKRRLKKAEMDHAERTEQKRQDEETR
ncbi:MAG TPA: type II toxin-antitoxin system RelE/ParE family toxin [Gemmataceae bacterium]|jgi:phage-related protein|nr:type II toxin-antitoxin system RelE/ParE family toxin [Gemmataceae bacterium]